MLSLPKDEIQKVDTMMSVGRETGSGRSFASEFLYPKNIQDFVDYRILKNDNLPIAMRLFALDFSQP
jgi:hypothetical protein